MKNLLLFMLLITLVSCAKVDTSNIKIAIPNKLAYNSTTEGHLVQLELFYYENNQWQPLQTFDSIFSRFGNDSLEIMDFNFDGFEDFRLFTGTAGRGANEYYEVFIQNPATKLFRQLEVDNIPNLQPDNSSKLILGTRFFSHKIYAEYYKIQGDSLVMTKRIEYLENGDWLNRMYEFYDENGNIISTKIDSVANTGPM